MKQKKIYLAGPYSDGDPEVEKERFEKLTKVAGQIIKEGHFVFSPITHCHPIAIQTSLPGNYEYWKKYNETFLRMCDELWLVTLKGYRDSKGLNAEFDLARELGKPYKFITEYYMAHEFVDEE